MTLETLYEFCAARPGLTLKSWAKDGTLRIIAERAPVEFSSVRFLYQTQADPMDGELTKTLNEISEALEEHDRTYSLALSGAGAR